MTGAVQLRVSLTGATASHVLFESGKMSICCNMSFREHVWKLVCVFLLWCLKISCFYLCKVFLQSNVCEIDTWCWKRLCKFHIRRLYVKEFFGQASFFAKSECQNGGLVRFVVHYPHNCWEHSGLSIATLGPNDGMGINPTKNNQATI